MLVHENKDYYIGDWQKNKAEGKGSFYHFQGMVYTGEWSDDLMHGRGE
jgi:hypothetical protein